MINRFTLEEQIMNCWRVVDDIKTLNARFQDKGDLSTDQVANYLLGLETIYEVKFEHLFEMFETLIKQGNIK